MESWEGDDARVWGCDVVDVDVVDVEVGKVLGGVDDSLGTSRAIGLMVVLRY
jgi:hypothetical protein